MSERSLQEGGGGGATDEHLADGTVGARLLLKQWKTQFVAALKKALSGIKEATLKLWKNYLPLLLVTLIGVLLVEFRVVILKALPWAQRHVKLVTVALDYFLIVFTTIEDVVILIVGAIRKLISLFTRKPSPHIHFKAYHTISASTVSEDLGLLAATCPAFDSGPKIVSQIFKYITKDNLCPVVRSLQVTKLKGISNSLLGWAVFDTDPYLVASCQPDVPASIEWTCIGFGVGLILVEVVVVAWVTLLVLPKFLPLLQQLASSVGKLL